MIAEYWIILGLLVLVSAVVILTGIKKQSGIGILVAAALIGIAIAFGHLQWNGLGFFAPESWLATILWSLGL